MMTPFGLIAPGWPDRVGNPNALTTGAGMAPSPFALSQLPVGSYLDYDSRINVTADGSNKVATWSDASGTWAFTASTTAEKPTLAADSWATGIPVLSFNGVDGGNILRGDEPHIDAYQSFLVARRSSADQNAVATNKTLYRTGRAADNLRIMTYMQRATSDTTQDHIYVLGPGGGSSPASGDGFGKGVKAIIGVRADGAANLAYVNSIASTAAPTGAVTEAGTYIGGDDSATSVRAKFDLARYLRVNAAMLPGGGEQVANYWLIEGALAWEYGLQGSLRADHLYKSHAPRATDYSGNNRLWIGWGNSLTYGLGGKMANAAAYNAAARGLTCENQGVSGETSDQIYARFQAATAAQLAKVTYLGDVWKNGGTDPDGQYEAMIVAVEAAHGMGAGNAHLVIVGDWIGFIAGSTEYSNPGRIAIDAKNAAIAAAHPNYYLDLFNLLVALGAPSGPYPDATAYAKGWVPDALRTGDTLHLNATGYIEAAKIVSAFIRAKTWDL
ncbi:hypothetical protein [Methylosinus sp. PW1]|uniref:SGNH/GDSL hydrolase family protein n=1 Tax=Methylosinus sp. PW1 TaxID=107636 RepID=UPI00056BD72F|nr:hypothetical protein [Methylosinus sp. PW1]